MRYRGKVDNNHAEIVEALRGIGASVVSLANLGNGCPDILVGWKGNNILFEIKSGRGGLTADEMKFMEDWEGNYRVVRTVEQAIGFVTDLDTVTLYVRKGEA